MEAFFSQEFLVSVRDDPPPRGYRQLTCGDLMDVALRSRLVAEHQTRGGWGLANTPLKFFNALVVADGWIRINSSLVYAVEQEFDRYSTTIAAHGFYSAIDSNTLVPWTTAPPAPDASWFFDTFNATRPSSPCLLVRVGAPACTLVAPPYVSHASHDKTLAIV